MSLSEIVHLGASIFDSTQLDLLKRWSKFDQNEADWRTILKNVTFIDSEKVVKFNVWKICEGKKSPSPGIAVKPQLISARKQPQPQRYTKIETSSDNVSNEEDKNVDGGDEGVLSATMSSGKPRPVTYKIIRKKDIVQVPKKHSRVVSDDLANDDEVETKTVKAIVRAKTGKYYYMQVHFDGESFYMSMQDKATKRSLYNKTELPAQFVEDVCGDCELDEKLNSLRAALEQLVKDCENIDSMLGN